MSSQLIELVESFAGKRVLLVGDFMIDRYVFGNAERLSPEAPVPVLRFDHEETRLGGAGHVAADLATLGLAVKAVGTVGDDEAGLLLRRMLDEFKIDAAGLIVTKARCTTSKTRLVGLANQRSPQQMIRLDYEQSTPVAADVAGQLVQAVSGSMAACDIVCIEDYNKGVVAPGVCQSVIQAARARGKQVLVDPASIADYSRYAGATCLKLNRSEAEKATGQAARQPEQYARAAKRLLDSLQLEAVVITLDKDGAYLATRDGTERRLATRPRQVADVTGAGDMVLAALAAARAGGAGWVEAVAIANIAGGIEVEKFGAVPVKREEIVEELLREHVESVGKERSPEQLVRELAAHRAAGRRIVFTNGCFDLIHLGHVKYFQYARAQGDLLVVGVNTDDGIRRLKGPKRPVVSEDDRIGVLEELRSIDYLVRFGDDTPQKLIEMLRPDVLVKGADYRKDQVVGGSFVESIGGRVALAPLIDGRSTTNVIKAIMDAHDRTR